MLEYHPNEFVDEPNNNKYSINKKKHKSKPTCGSDGEISSSIQKQNYLKKICSMININVRKTKKKAPFNISIHTTRKTSYWKNKTRT